MNLCKHGEFAKRIYAYEECAKHNCGDSRMQNFSISGECAKKIYAYIENAQKKPYMENVRKEYMCICIQNLCAERIYALMENARNSVILPNCGNYQLQKFLSQKLLNLFERNSHRAEQISTVLLANAAQQADFSRVGGIFERLENV